MAATMTAPARVGAITVGLATALVCVAASPARADHGHLEATFAFVAGRRDYRGAPFARDSGEVSPGLSAPLSRAPFDSAEVAGPSGELRLVIDDVRMSYGRSRLYARPGPSDSATLASGEAAPAQIRSLDAIETLYALGVEHTLGPVTLFGDLVGIADDVRTQVVVGEEQLTFRARSFGYAARSGLRVRFSRYAFVHASAEIGLVGDTTSTFMVGVGLTTK